MQRLLPLFAVVTLFVRGPAALLAQDEQPPIVDSIAVEGQSRLTASQIIGTSGLIVKQPVNYRDIQRAITALFRTGQFDDVVIEQQPLGEALMLLVRVKERPMLEKWAVRGVTKVSENEVKSRVRLAEGRPLDRNAVEQSRASIDSLYKHDGYYSARIKTLELAQDNGKVRIVYRRGRGPARGHQPGRRRGQQALQRQAGGQAHGHPARGLLVVPEGRVRRAESGPGRPRAAAALVRGQRLRRLPGHPRLAGGGLRGRQGGAPSDRRGRAAVRRRRLRRRGRPAVLDRGAAGLLSVRSGGPDGHAQGPSRPFSRSDWDGATEKVQNLYANNGYIYAQVEPAEIRRTGADGKPVVDLKWLIREGSPATINKVEIVGNDVTHERVIREAIVMLPGDLFSRERLIRSYQNVSNLGFFQQPMPSPDVKPSANGVDVDIIFRVEERRTGNINFGASLGQGTGVGGFLGLEEPNLFGRGKRGKLQWQFGKNINDFTLSYTDPAIRESRISGTVSLFDSRARYTIGDLGRRKQTGGTVQIGFPFLGSRYTRFFTSYSYQRVRYSEGSVDLRARFSCSACSRSTVGTSVLRDTRVGLPFAVGGSFTNVSAELNGGFLGGTGNYRKVDMEGRWYAPLGTLGGAGQLGGGVQFVLGLTAKSGFIFGDAGPFFTELYSLGGVQYGVPLRGYDEFSITPNGFDPSASGNQASPDAFGKSYAAFTVEAGARISQSLYLSAFFDAGNVYRSSRQWDPTRLFRGAGFGGAVISPLGPIGVDLGYGFDRVDGQGRPDPGWQLHFKLGNFF